MMKMVPRGPMIILFDLRQENQDLQQVRKDIDFTSVAILSEQDCLHFGPLWFIYNLLENINSRNIKE